MRMFVLCVACAHMIFASMVNADVLTEKPALLVSESLVDQKGHDSGEAGEAEFSPAADRVRPERETKQRLDLEIDLGIEVDIDLDVGNSPS